MHEDGDDIVHYISEPVEEGTQINGVVDMERRVRLMQQHSGEHIVSGIIHHNSATIMLAFTWAVNL